MNNEKRETALLRESNRAIGRTIRLHHRICERRLSALPIHRAQHMLLMHLADEGSTPSQKELAERMEITPAAVAMALKRLEADGYITRKSNESDSRINATSLTRQGRETVNASRAIFDEIDRTMYKGITEEEIFSLMKTLGKLESNLKSTMEDAAL